MSKLNYSSDTLRESSEARRFLFIVGIFVLWLVFLAFLAFTTGRRPRTSSAARASREEASGRLVDVIVPLRSEAVDTRSGFLTDTSALLGQKAHAPLW